MFHLRLSKTFTVDFIHKGATKTEATMAPETEIFGEAEVIVLVGWQGLTHAQVKWNGKVYPLLGLQDGLGGSRTVIFIAKTDDPDGKGVWKMYALPALKQLEYWWE